MDLDSKLVEESNWQCAGWVSGAEVGEKGKERKPCSVNVYAHSSLAFSKPYLYYFWFLYCYFKCLKSFPVSMFLSTWFAFVSAEIIYCPFAFRNNPALNEFPR